MSADSKATTVAPTLHIERDRIVIDASLVHFGTASTLSWFFVATIMQIAMTCVFLANVRARLLAAERRMRSQAWQLGQISSSS